MADEAPAQPNTPLRTAHYASKSRDLIEDAKDFATNVAPLLHSRTPVPANSNATSTVTVNRKPPGPRSKNQSADFKDGNPLRNPQSDENINADDATARLNTAERRAELPKRDSSPKRTVLQPKSQPKKASAKTAAAKPGYNRKERSLGKLCTQYVVY